MYVKKKNSLENIPSYMAICDWNDEHSLLEILSFVTNQYTTGMQLIDICNYRGHVCNYKFSIV
jgi:hypothetical protein